MTTMLKKFPTDFCPEVSSSDKAIPFPLYAENFRISLEGMAVRAALTPRSLVAACHVF
jgi:hypothetical protein